MLAIFKTGGKQYSVKAGQILKVEKLSGKKGDDISFKDVLAITDSALKKIGSPLIEGASVKAKIVEQIRDKKIIVFKKRQRQNYRHTQGHRQYLTVLKIESIDTGDKKTSATKKIDSKKEIIKTDVAKKDIKKKTAPIKKKMAPKTTTKTKVTATKKKLVKKNEKK